MWPFADVDAMQNETARGNKVVEGHANTSNSELLAKPDAPANDGVMRRQRS
jgi:hypothetical protein